MENPRQLVRDPDSLSPPSLKASPCFGPFSDLASVTDFDLGTLPSCKEAAIDLLLKSNTVAEEEATNSKTYPISSTKFLMS